MNSLENNEHNLDRLSALPDSLIHEILSLLTMRDVVRTSLLSKRWNLLWVTTPCLQFDEYGEPDTICNFVSRALMLWRGTHLQKLSFDLMSADESNEFSSDIDLWVLVAKQRKVEELLILISYRAPFYCPPQCLYGCSSLRKLKLLGCDLQIDGGVRWDHLNSLDLTFCCLSEDGLNRILASSTQLETVILDNMQECESLSIRSCSLKKLFVHSVSILEYAMTIYAPNLEALRLRGVPLNKYLLTNLSSLTEVLLDFKEWTGAGFEAAFGAGFEAAFGAGFEAVLEEALCQILPAIQHVATVTLSASCFEMLGVVNGKFASSPLLNVNLLRIGGSLTGISKLVRPLEVFPKLKALIIDWEYDEKLFEFNGETYTTSEANILKSNLMQLRRVEIFWSRYQVSIFQFIECLLKHVTMIEKVVSQQIVHKVVDSEAMFLGAQKVVSLQRSFPSVEFILRKCSEPELFYSDF